MYFVIIAITMGLSWLVSNTLKSRFKEYSSIPTRSGLSGAEIAQKMLNDNGIYDVKVTAVRGQLTDHYNPTNKTVNLSEWVYGQSNVAAAAVAAHEVGHAIQHATAYSFLTFRSKMVPVVSISSRILQWVLMGGIVLFVSSGIPWLLAIGIGLFAVTTLFAFVTLPVEFDASNRALVWLNSANITTGQEHEKAKGALKWAAMTYVVAAIGSLAQLLYFASILLRGRN